MAFPSITNASSGSGTSRLSTIGTPSGSGGLLVAMIVAKVSDTIVVSSGTGWTKVGQSAAGNPSLAVFTKVATGSDTLTIDCASVGGTAPTWRQSIVRVAGAASATATFARAFGVNEPPAHNAGAADDYLWIAAVGVGDSGSVSAGPANYSNAVLDQVDDTALYYASRQLNASSEDPGFFNRGTAAWTAVTIAAVPAVVIAPQKISELSDISLPLNGSEVLLVSEDGVDSQYPVSSLMSDIQLAPYTNNTKPSVPATGLTVYASDKAGRMRPSWIVPGGQSYSIQALLGENKCGFWSAVGATVAAHNGTTGAGVTRLNFGDTRVGTATLRFVSSDTESTVFTRSRRIGFITSGAANSQAGTRHAVQQFSRQMGFDYVIRFGFTAPLLPGAKFFAGFASSTTAFSATTESTGLGNTMGLILASTDDSFSMFSRANGTTNTKIPLSNTLFPRDTGNVDLFELRLFCTASDTTQVFWSMTNLTTEAYQEGTFSSSFLTPTTFLLSPQITLSQGSVAADAIGVDVVNQYIETDI